ncbi:hypothetical protein C1645_838699 [Glomus cerebriforme]|uniref:Uncharacterized protein n=1 Tax=Glomus cerebriforme TaxID=658196 RepID=A0A397SCI8_9GLOM|nr:hypothetical protein C1645_838699 [Glomus cerebriforme]
MEENLNELLENPNDIKRTTNKREKTSWIWRYFNIEICNAQLLRIVERISFCKLIYELDPKFDMPDSKSVKAMIHIAYNYTFKALADLSVDSTK